VWTSPGMLRQISERGREVHSHQLSCARSVVARAAVIAHSSHKTLDHDGKSDRHRPCPCGCYPSVTLPVGVKNYHGGLGETDWEALATQKAKPATISTPHYSMLGHLFDVVSVRFLSGFHGQPYSGFDYGSDKTRKTFSINEVTA
jgi:hypothetical protein